MRVLVAVLCYLCARDIRSMSVCVCLLRWKESRQGAIDESFLCAIYLKIFHTHTERAKYERKKSGYKYFVYLCLFVYIF
jgi:hypothetical protein